MIKKILSLFIALCTVAAVMPAAYAKTKYKRLSTYDAVALLQTLDMINDGYDSSTIDEHEKISRAELCDVLAQVFAKGKESNTLYFHDISRDDWEFEPVSILAQEGYIKVDDTQMFYPDEPATRAFAARIILYALGYGVFLDIQDASDETVDKLAERIGLYKNTSAGELDFADMVMLCYNGLITNVMEITGVSSENLPEFEQSDETFLEKRYSSYLEEGILEGFDGISITNLNVAEHEALISGAVFEAENFDLTDSIGSKILYLYSYDKKSDTRTLIWLKEDEDDEQLELDYYDNIVSFDKDTYKLSYYANERTRYITLDRSVNVIYNGEFVKSGIEELLSGFFYSMRLIKTEDDKNYGTVIMQSYENYKVDAIDSVNECIYDKNNKALSLKNRKRIDIYSADGERLQFEDIKTGVVISSFESISKDRIKLIVSDKTVSGYVSASDRDEGFSFLTVDDTEYRSAEKVQLEINAGSDVILYIDAQGYIAYTESFSSSDNLAYLINIMYDDVEETLILKLFDTSGKIIKLNATTKLKINDEKYTNALGAYYSLGGNEFIPQLISYNKNAKGLVSKISTVTENKKSLHVSLERATLTYRNVGKFGRKLYINGNTVIFGIPNEPKSAQEEDFRICSQSDLLIDTNYTVTSYATKPDVEYEEVLVIENADWIKGDTINKAGILVQNVDMCVNSDGDVVERIVGYQASSKVELMCTVDYSAKAEGVSKGDYILISTNQKGEVKKADIRYSFTSGIRPVEENLYQRIAVSSGWVNKVTGNIVRIGINSGADFDEAYSFATGTVLIYNKKNGKITVGSRADLISYEAAGENCSFVVAHMRYSAPLVYIIYK